MTDDKKLKTELDENAVSPEITSKWSAPAESKLNEYLNREKFSYDVNGDALYKQYADKFKLGGRMAMMDTMGQASVMTGGYGNSYAQSVGQQAYQGYMQQLNDVVPELYSLAYGMYNDEGERMLNEYALLSGREETDYNRAIDDRKYNYQLDRDKVEDEQWRETFDYTKEQDAYANKLTEAQIAASLGDYSKYEELGYDTSNAGKTIPEYDDVSTADINALYELASTVITPEKYTANIAEYDRIIKTLKIWEAQGANPDVIEARATSLIPEGYLEYVNKHELPPTVDTTVKGGVTGNTTGSYGASKGSHGIGKSGFSQTIKYV